MHHLRLSEEPGSTVRKDKEAVKPRTPDSKATLYRLPRLTVHLSFAPKILGLKNIELLKVLDLKNIELAFTSALVLPLPSTAALLHLRGHAMLFTLSIFQNIDSNKSLF